LVRTFLIANRMNAASSTTNTLINALRLR
jgi:hypothetical protein